MKSFATAAALVGAASAAYQPHGYGYGSLNGNLSTTMTTPTAPIDGGSFTGEPAEPTVTAIVSSFTTVCPTPTTLTYNDKTYTVSESTTLTITECPCTITTPVKSYHEPTVTAIVKSYETYCPHPTTFTAGTSTYTVTKATTVTVTNAGDCTIVTPIGSLPHKPTDYPKTPTWTYEQPSTTPEKPKPSVYVPTWNATTKYTTETVSSYVTYCPTPMTISHGSSTITVTSPTTVTFTNCPCTITNPYVPSTYWTTEHQTQTVTTYCPPGTHTVGTITTTVSQPTTLTYTQTSVVSKPVTTTQYLTKPVYPTPETTTITKEISSVYMTYCPSPTTIYTMGTSYPVQTPGTVSIPVISTSIYTSVKPAPPQPTVYQPAPSQPAQPPASQPILTTPTSPEQPATTGRVITQISDGQIQAPTGTGAAQPPAQSQPVEELPSASPSVQAYQGAASKMASSGAGVIAILAGALFF